MQNKKNERDYKHGGGFLEYLFALVQHIPAPAVPSISTQILNLLDHRHFPLQASASISVQLFQAVISVSVCIKAIS